MLSSLKQQMLTRKPLSEPTGERGARVHLLLLRREGRQQRRKNPSAFVKRGSALFSVSFPYEILHLLSLRGILPSPRHTYRTKGSSIISPKLPMSSMVFLSPSGSHVFLDRRFFLLHLLSFLPNFYPPLPPSRAHLPW